MHIKRLLVLTAALSGLLGSWASAQVTIPLNAGDSARIMGGFNNPNAYPVHLGGDGSVAGGAQGGGASINDTGDTIVGDGGGANQLFSLVLMFDSTEEARELIESGFYKVMLHGKTLYSVTDELNQETVKTTGSVDWSPIVVSRQGYGSSTSGPFGDFQFKTAAAWNLNPADDTTGGVYDYAASASTVPNDETVYAEDVPFSLDITDIVDPGMLSADNDRLVIALSAVDPETPAAFSNFNGTPDRVAFYASEFMIEVVPVNPLVVPVTVEDSARIMGGFNNPNAYPVHLGGDGSVAGGAQGGGASINDSGDAIIGDGGGANQPFGLVLMFDSNPALRDVIDSGTYTVKLHGRTLYSVVDELDQEVVKTTGGVDWAPIVVSRQGYGSSTSGNFGDFQFKTAAAWNLNPADEINGAVYDYAAAMETIPNNDAVNSADTAFSVDITDLIDPGMLSADNDRLVIAVSALDPASPGDFSNFNGTPDRVAFYGTEFAIEVLPTAPNVMPVVVEDSARIMGGFNNPNAYPVHLGGDGSVAGGARGGGASINDTGDAIVGDGGGANQPFGLVLMFDSNPTVREILDSGVYTVKLHGRTLYSVQDELEGEVVKTTGGVDWAPIVVSRQGYGSSTSGNFGDFDFLTAAAWNLNPEDEINGAVYDYAAALDTIPNNDAVNSADTAFSVDITDLIDPGMLSADNDRLVIAVSALDPASPGDFSNFNGTPDRVAFYGTEFAIEVLPTAPNVMPVVVEDSARIMGGFNNPNAYPVHLGGDGSVAGGARGGGASINDTGDSIIGDGGGANQLFSLVLMFDSNPTVREILDSGTYSVTLHGRTLYSVQDELEGEVVKTTGGVDWAPIVVSRQGYGSSASGNFGDFDFLTAAAWNLNPADDISGAVYDYAASMNSIPNDEAVNSADTAFSVDITDLLDPGMLTVDNDRLVLAVSALDPADPGAFSNFNGTPDRVAFYGTEFAIEVSPNAPNVIPVVVEDSARIMGGFNNPNAYPVHFGGDGSVAGGATGGGSSINDTGDSIVGDGGGANQLFSLVLMFDTNQTVRDIVDSGNYEVYLNGSTLHSVTDELDQEVLVTKGSVDWAPIVVSRQGYGNSVTGIFGDFQWLTAAAWNLSSADTVTNGVYDYKASATNLPNDAAVYEGDVPFSADITDLVDPGMLTAENDRLVLALSAIDPASPSDFSNFNGTPDRVAFYGTQFALEFVEVPPPAMTFNDLVSAVEAGEGSFISPWFGAYAEGTSDWIFHAEQGWLYTGYVSTTDSMWFWGHTLQTYLWTSESIYPVMYDASGDRWIYYFILDDVGGFLFDYSTMTWGTLP